jgi:cytochrome c-type biogenesis protein CcmH
MTWLVILVLAGAGFALAAVLFGLPRSAYALTGMALMLGLAGYAWQGSADLPGAPTAVRPAPPQSQEVVIAARRAMFGGDIPPARYVAVADGFARKGQTQDAAGFLKLAVRENPADAEAWVALGNAMVSHAQGNLTPAAVEAFSRAERLAPNSPAPHYFAGLALLRAGRAPDTRRAWAAALERVPADAPYRSIIAGQLAQLDQAIRAIDAQRSQRDVPQPTGAADAQ